MATDNRVEKEEKDLNEEYSVFLKHLKAEKEESSRFAKTMFFIVIFFCAIVLLLLIASEYKSDIIKTFGENSFATKMLLIFPANIKNKQKVKFTMPFLPRRQNILLCGVDANGSTRDPWTGARTDTIIVLNVDPASKSVNAISIPRDSKVYLPGDFGIQKINSAHAIGGINMTIKTIEQTLGIKIDHYVMVHDNAVEHIVDTLGGIPIYVEKNMYYNDYSGDLHINLSKGLNILSGKNAVGYLRFRKDGLGDIGRTRRQQWFIKGLLEKIQQPQTIAKIPELVQTVSQYVKTDMSIYEISQYASMTKSFDAIFVTGGDADVLSREMNRTGFSQVLKAAVDAGLIYVGISAGSMFAAGNLDEGLHIIPNRIFPHWNGDKMIKLPEKGEEIFLADGQAVYIEDDQCSLL